jgi:hypothetical protein
MIYPPHHYRTGYETKYDSDDVHNGIVPMKRGLGENIDRSKNETEDAREAVQQAIHCSERLVSKGFPSIVSD